MSRPPTLGELFQEIHTWKQDKSQWVDVRLETTYVSTYNISFQYFNLLYLLLFKYNFFIFSNCSVSSLNG